ncbi:MAG: sigma-70 family RNA polymerase sigma factor [Reichenbachiella sp.]|uniref:sigma-70 family RNA polymerase sigma factor n=1 Tax=Reichenbachiella sp. TaxID=2184521 RepID=UPI003267870D
MENYQDKLFPFAYNIVGSVEDAKDVVQDVVIKHYASDSAGIDNVMGYLVKSVINHAINTKKRNQKIVADRLWLPEPMATDRSDANINREEIISYSLLVMLEKLSARERAVFILKEAFDYSHSEIGDVLDISIENARKLLSRSKKKIHSEEYQCAPANHKQSSSYLNDYIKAIKNGDVKSLEKMLSEDISLTADGGGQIKVVRELTEGRKLSLKILFYVFQTYQEFQTIKITEVNHQPALLFYDDETLTNCQVFELDESQSMVKKIYSVLDPAKLELLS